MTVSIGTFGNVGRNGGQPIDTNPSVPCEMCGEGYRWQDYWQDRLSDPDEQPFWCDSCWNILIEQARIDRQKERNEQITDY